MGCLAHPTVLGVSEGVHPSLREKCLSLLGNCGAIRNLPNLGGEAGTLHGAGESYTQLEPPSYAQRKSLRERWLMDGAPEGSEGPEDPSSQDPQSPKGQAQARIRNLEDSLFT